MRTTCITGTPFNFEPSVARALMPFIMSGRIMGIELGTQASFFAMRRLKSLISSYPGTFGVSHMSETVSIAPDCPLF